MIVFGGKHLSGCHFMYFMYYHIDAHITGDFFPPQDYKTTNLENK